MSTTTSANPLETTWPSLMGSPPEATAERTPVLPALAVRAFGRTDPGKVRAANEDHFLIASPAWGPRIQQSSLHTPDAHYADVEGELFVVADGMGGHAGGAQASALAVDQIEVSLLSTLKWLFALGNPDETDGSDLLGQLKAALWAADARVCDEAARSPALRGMGTTVTLAFRHGSWLFIAHVGDSRCYMLRDGKLHRLTQDHTLVSEMVRRGVMSSEEAAHHGLRHVITNAVGGPMRGIRAEVHRVALAPGDVVLLCTDGLTDMVTDPEITAILNAQPNPRAACDKLVELANDHGGVDNITAIVARFEPAEPPPSGAPRSRPSVS